MDYNIREQLSDWFFKKENWQSHPQDKDGWILEIPLQGRLAELLHDDLQALCTAITTFIRRELDCSIGAKINVLSSENNSDRRVIITLNDKELKTWIDEAENINDFQDRQGDRKTESDVKEIGNSGAFSERVLEETKKSRQEFESGIPTEPITEEGLESSKPDTYYPETITGETVGLFNEVRVKPSGGRTEYGKIVEDTQRIIDHLRNGGRAKIDLNATLNGLRPVEYALKHGYFGAVDILDPDTSGGRYHNYGRVGHQTLVKIMEVAEEICESASLKESPLEIFQQARKTLFVARDNKKFRLRRDADYLLTEITGEKNRDTAVRAQSWAENFVEIFPRDFSAIRAILTHIAIQNEHYEAAGILSPEPQRRIRGAEFADGNSPDFLGDELQL